jgi:hypothetical protein
MYEICRFLAATTPKAPKTARAPRKPSAKIGAKVLAYGMNGEIIGKNATGFPWQLRCVSANGSVHEFGANRSAFDVVD